MLETRASGRSSKVRKPAAADRATRVQPSKPRPRPETTSQERAGVRDTARPISRMRSLLVVVFIVLCSAGLTSRLVFWQVLDHGKLYAMARAEHAALDVQPPVRGQILDDHGNPLATDVNMDVVYAVPKEIKDPARTASLLAPVLGESAKHLSDLFAQYTGYIILAPRVSEATSNKIRNLALPGIVLDTQVRRTYPEGSVASQLVGYVDANNHGQYGLEGNYDQLLSGTAGLRSVLKDTAGNDIHISSAASTPSHAGADLHLSLDGVVQGLVEDELQKAVKAHTADGGTIIVMDPHTGYILGMASRPTYDPNRYNQTKDYRQFINPATTDLYEPGSTFKIVTMAAGLDTGVVKPQTAFDDTGAFVVGDRVLHNWNMSGFGWETMTQVLQHSANVGAAWVAQQLGTDRFYTYIKRFHLGAPTGVDLAGEQAGLVHAPGDKQWSLVTQYTNAFGQGIALTPLQVIRAVATVANGGVMMKPQVVKQVVYQGHVIDHPPVSQGRVISAQTARTLTHMLVESAIGGEASLGLVKGYDIAAKTGTANIAGPNGQYLQDATIASIVGYAPAYNPRFVILVKIDHPRDTPWGSMAAAPVLHNLMQDLFMYYHIPPSPHALNR